MPAIRKVAANKDGSRKIEDHVISKDRIYQSIGVTNQRRPTLVLQQVGRVGNGSNLKAMIMKRNNFNMPAEKKPEIPPAPARRPSIPYFRG